jgi:hypothetical protein
MKKILLIISTIILFSIPTFSFANDGTIEELLDIKYGPEVFELEMIEFPAYSFNDTNMQSTYDTYVKNMNLLKKAIIEKYSNDEFDYYQMKWIIRSFSNFVYYTNLMFEGVKEKENGNNDRDISRKIKRNYETSRTFYNKLRNIVFKK